jgi:nucleotide-binding universal stress UspA family protein
MDISNPFSRILVPITDERRSTKVLDSIESLAARCGSRVVLLHVHDDVVTIEGPQNGPKEPSASTMRVLRSCQERLTSQGIDSEILVRHGSPANQILATALELRTDLIAMATRSRTGVKRFLLGSVAQEVVRSSKLPVLLVSH